MMMSSFFSFFSFFSSSFENGFEIDFLLVYVLNAIKLSYAVFLLLMSLTFLNVRVQRLDLISKNVSSTSTMFRPKSIGFFHPFTSDGGGGERVLWQFVKLMREKYPTARLVIYTGDTCDDGKRKKKLILERAKERFGVDIDIDDDDDDDDNNSDNNKNRRRGTIEFKRVYFRTLSQSKWYPWRRFSGKCLVSLSSP